MKFNLNVLVFFSMLGLLVACNYQTGVQHEMGEIESPTTDERPLGDTTLIDDVKKTDKRAEPVVPNALEEARRALKQRGYEINRDSIDSDETTEALRNFQRDNNLPVTGRLDDATRRALNISPLSSERRPASIDDSKPERSTD